MGKDKVSGTITTSMISEFKKAFLKDPSNKMALNAVTRGNLSEIALNRDVLNQIDFCFSNEVETADVTDQKKSGTCWLFAILNWFRFYTQNKMNVKQFEFSQNQVMFWDKFEKANFFLEKMIELRTKDIDDRHLRFLLSNPASDGGEWHMLVNIANKYGLMPKSVMPDTFNRENTRYLNELLYYMLRQTAAEIRQAHNKGTSIEKLRKIKLNALEDVYRLLAIFLGIPPDTFSWSYRDKDKKFVRETNITPKEFVDKYVGLNLDEIFCLLSCPSPRTPFNKTYVIDYFDNMVDGVSYRWLNLPVKDLKQIAIKMLKKEQPVLFGNDVVQQCHTKEGVLFKDVYEFESIFKFKFNMDKATRVDFGQTQMTHSMVLTGVDIVNNKPVKWKVENSWGSEVGKKGYFIMSDEWFDENVFDLVVPKEYLSKKQLELLKQDPIVLPPWFPMA
ncbi:C1 family peptidase [bacterium]|nr:C1 family peptidase [candidate division CSSED10-310 bacterium]